ncbi:beta-lactamase domain-containing protein 2-like [Ruditapes philippinarum]|uniref:beta-lactamase domain-containing protein 2-like n=1 Tax=Ruditapes philippinarum TaxID=129788 RepID=UPI00295A64CA|nr:beta-lactamase domain-containing protein 2-like [Ruditapes philippinarum]
MGFIRQSVTFCVLIVLYTYISSLLEQKLPVNVDGYYHPAFKRVAEVFRKSVENNRNPGIAFAAYHKGDLVFDMWGGYADFEAQSPWKNDTITLGYSASKGVAAIVVAKMVEMGYLDYNRPIAHYWPEFAQQGKENITVEMLMSHQAGLAIIDESIHLRDIKENPEKVERILARQKTSWPAGQALGYHTVSYGPYVDTLVRKADPKGREITKIFKEDIADIHGLDMWMNTPNDQFYRAARINQDPIWKFLLKAFMVPKYAKMFTNLILFPKSVFARSTQTVVELAEYAPDRHSGGGRKKNANYDI